MRCKVALSSLLVFLCLASEGKAATQRDKLLGWLNANLPTGVAFATDMRQCTELTRRWSQVQGQITTAHGECLQANEGNHQPGRRCSRAECEDLHRLMISPELGEKRNTQLNACRNSVSQHQTRVREETARRREDERRRSAQASEGTTSLSSGSPRESMYQQLKSLNEDWQAIENRYAFAKNLFRLNSARNDWKQQYEATVGLTKSLSAEGSRLWLSKTLTDLALDNLQQTHLSVMQQFDQAMVGFNRQYMARLQSRRLEQARQGAETQRQQEAETRDAEEAAAPTVSNAPPKCILGSPSWYAMGCEDREAPTQAYEDEDEDEDEDTPRPNPFLTGIQEGLQMWNRQAQQWNQIFEQIERQKQEATDPTPYNGSGIGGTSCDRGPTAPGTIGEDC